MFNQFWKSSIRTYNNLIDLSKQLDGLKNDIEELSNQKVLSSRSYKIVIDYLTSRLLILTNRFSLIQKDFSVNQKLIQIQEIFRFFPTNQIIAEKTLEEKQIFELFEYIENELFSIKKNLGLEKQRLIPMNSLGFYSLPNPQSQKNRKRKFLKRATERTGLVPRSIIRTLRRFFIQLNSSSESLIVQEFRISRYQGLVSLRTFLTLALVPSLLSEISKTLVFKPLIEYLWNKNQTEIFLNHSQQERAFQQLKDFEEQLYFEELLSHVEDFEKLIGNRDFDLEGNQGVRISEKMLEIAKEYNHETLDCLIRICGDISFFIALVALGWLLRPQLIILQSFITEFLYALSDTTKSFFIILLTELLVGFHSLNGWEVFLKSMLERFGLPENEEFIMLCIATFPVLLDTAFKYWIFRYLNKLSPSTVVTYHSMIE
uniref:Potassium/proton antiporter CemA n=1 Tax=Pedinomonas tuberculata TaxID=160064 RepID=A0A097KL19_9CHLO|nr:chloroplast enveloppe membrane protein [Pedinomonas tuberculata]AIT93884.1 chloroplast enveloppe membrane protein [Pedinomonas tuberculata]